MNKEDARSPKLTVPQIISYCKEDLGITFQLMGERQAMDFLQKNNFFFRLKQYAQTCTERTEDGKYKGLDFGHLVELSIIDMFLRKHLFKMTVDLEHYMKVKLVNDCQTNVADDGYEVVKKFLDRKPELWETINKFANGNFYGENMFRKYVETPSVWSFVEMVTFFDFTHFYDFYYNVFWQDSESFKHLDAVRRLRNACAHNSSLISSFKRIPDFTCDTITSFELQQEHEGAGAERLCRDAVRLQPAGLFHHGEGKNISGDERFLWRKNGHPQRLLRVIHRPEECVQVRTVCARLLLEAIGRRCPRHVPQAKSDGSCTSVLPQKIFYGSRQKVCASIFSMPRFFQNISAFVSFASR